MDQPLPLLVIDDDATTRELLLLLLSNAGWDATTAADGDEALAALRTSSAPAVILSDLQMPGLCGPPLAEAIRSITPAPVLLAMTATPLPETPKGYDALLVKPFKPEAVRVAFDAVRAAASVPKPQPAKLQQESGPPVLDTAVLDRLRKSMPNDRLRSFIGFVVDDAGARIARMDEAARKGDDAAYRTEAHALKGGCGMVGAMQLRALAAEAENEGLLTGPLTEWKPMKDFLAAITSIRLMLETLSRGDI